MNEKEKKNEKSLLSLENLLLDKFSKNIDDKLITIINQNNNDFKETIITKNENNFKEIINNKKEIFELKNLINEIQKNNNNNKHNSDDNNLDKDTIQIVNKMFESKENTGKILDLLSLSPIENNIKAEEIIKNNNNHLEQKKEKKRKKRKERRKREKQQTKTKTKVGYNRI